MKIARYIALLVLVLASSPISPLWAAPWGVAANYTNATITTVDLGTSPSTVHGPFLSGQLGAVGINDLAITPDSKYALVSSYNGCTVYRIDLTDPSSPVLAGSISLPAISGAPVPGCYTPMDISIAPNGQFAIVSSGRSLLIPPQAPTNMLGFIDLVTFTYTGTYTLTTTNGSAQAVAIAADNQTVIMADRAGGAAAAPFPGRIIFGAVNASQNGLISESTLATGSNSYPINISISPDGQTALVSTALTTVNVFKITGPGTVVASATPTVAGLPGRQQSIAFSPDGQKAYALSTTPIPHQLSWLQVSGPDNVTLGGAAVVTTLLTSGNANRVLGVDVVAVTPDGSYALIGNPSLPGDTTSNNFSRVDLSTFARTTVTTSGSYPMGTDIFLGVPVVTTASVTNIAGTTATGGGSVTPNAARAVTQSGVCWSTSANPTTADTCTTDGSVSGPFTSALTGLALNTIYHVRAYAQNSAGTAYGNDVQFTTLAFLPPTVTTTSPITNITASSATGGGNISDDGGSPITERGVCWGTSPNPISSCTSDGTGTGAFTSSLTGLTQNTPYYVRAFATNAAGTTYGSDQQFTTLAAAVNIPTLNEWGVIIFMVLSGFGAVVYLRKKRRTES